MLDFIDNPFQKSFAQLWESNISNKFFFQQVVLKEVTALIKQHNDLEELYQYAMHFDEAGVFIGTPWENIQKLNPTLVRGTICAGGDMASAEILSDLRILAIARGEYIHPQMSSTEASEFLTKVLALNVDFLLMKETEENRVKNLHNDKEVAKFFKFISERFFSPLVFQSLYEEINNLAVQRPIVTNKILELISSAKKLSENLEDKNANLNEYENAIYSPSNLSSMFGYDYENNLIISNDTILFDEANQLRSSMIKTGLVSDFHVIFLNYINKEKPELLKNILTVDETSKNNLNSNLHLISSIIYSSLNINTKNSIYGLYRLLQRDIFTKEFISELIKLLNIPIHEKIISKLSKIHNTSDKDVIRSFLISGMISILGQPLGIGQGFNPTCQSVRTISYWSQKNPVMLIKIYSYFLENNKVIIDFEGIPISSDMTLQYQLDDEINIDVVTLLMVPHLTSIYLEILRLASSRGQDPHKWINPAFHINGVWEEFSDIYIDSDFKNRFYQYYHPLKNPNVNEALPQPVGITIYSQTGQVLGAHAILIQRICADPSGRTRVYFYNPNNDSLQKWANSIQTSVFGNGEIEGESSLLFEDFIKVLYAFHFPNNFQKDS